MSKHYGSILRPWVGFQGLQKLGHILLPCLKFGCFHLIIASTFSVTFDISLTKS